MFPNDITSFLLGAGTVAVVWFISSFVGAAGGDAWGLLKKKLKPDPIEVTEDFKPNLYAKDDCKWLDEDLVLKYEERGYSYYPHPRNGAKCYRRTIYPPYLSKVTQWLMVKSGAEKIVI